MTGLKHLWLVALVGCGGSAPPPGRDGGPIDGGPIDADAIDGGSIAATVTRYDYRFDLASGEASSRLAVRTDATGTGCVELASRLPLRDLAASSDGAGAPGLVAGQADHRVTVCGAHTAGGTFTLEARATVVEGAEPITGVGLLRAVDWGGNAFSYLLAWIEACDRLGPCDPAPARLAHFTFEVSHGAGDTVLCPGALIPGGETTRCALLGSAAPTYSSFAIAANAGWRRTPLVAAAGVSVATFEAPPGAVTAALDPAAVGGFLDWMTARFGSFPYGDELRIATGPVAWMGMEHPANIVVRDDLLGVMGLYRDTPLNVVLHEIAHQWAGDRTTLASALDFVWKEAIAEFLVYAYEDERGMAEDVRVMRALWRRIGRGAPYPIRPLAPPAVDLSTWTYGGYGAGPMALFVQLEPWLGRAALLDALRAFLAESGARSMDDLRVVLEADSGLDLRPYFDAWVFGASEPVWPIFDVATASSGSDTTVTVTQVQEGGVVFPCVVEVEVRGATQAKRVAIDFGPAPTSPAASARVTLDEPVTATRVDPDGRLLGWAMPSAVPDPAPPAVRWHP